MDLTKRGYLYHENSSQRDSVRRASVNRLRRPKMGGMGRGRPAWPWLNNKIPPPPPWHSQWGKERRERLANKLPGRKRSNYFQLRTVLSPSFSSEPFSSLTISRVGALTPPPPFPSFPPYWSHSPIFSPFSGEGGLRRKKGVDGDGGGNWCSYIQLPFPSFLSAQFAHISLLLLFPLL